MQIRSLKIDDFKNLKGFSINFSGTEPMTVIVGRNGAGKSNVLEAIIVIFRDFEVKANNTYTPSFKYELTYTIRDLTITIDADPRRYKGNRRDFYNIAVQPREGSASSLSLNQFVAEDRPYLPKYVFGYYSGFTTRFEELFEKPAAVFRDRLLEGELNPPRRLFLAQPRIHSQFALLAFFQDEDEEIPRFLREELWITGLETVLFVVREPYWAKKKWQKAAFWNATGVVRPLMEHIYRLATAPMVQSKKVELTLGRTKSLEHLYLFLRTPNDLRGLAARYRSADGRLDRKAFFNALEHIHMSDLLGEVRSRVFVEKAQGSLTFRELSEGEQQLLMVLGLMRFTKEEEALFLLDEPDTHLNPTWSVNYLDFIKRVVGDTQTSHLIMTTHNPLTLASLTREQVVILYREEETGKVTSDIADQNPRGMGVGGILTSDIFGLRSVLDPITLQALDRQRKLSVKAEETPLTVNEQVELAKLNDEVSDLDFRNVVRDPLYPPYVSEITKYNQEQELNKLVLSPEERKNQRKRVREIVRRLKQENDEA